MLPRQKPSKRPSDRVSESMARAIQSARMNRLQGPASGKLNGLKNGWRVAHGSTITALLARKAIVALPAQDTAPEKDVYGLTAYGLRVYALNRW